MRREVAIVLGAVFVACRRSPTAGSAIEPDPGIALEASPPIPPEVRACMPVAACRMFISCAEVVELGGDRVRVVAYEHHPHIVGQTYRTDALVWATDAGPASARAMIYDDVPCTPVPSTQMPLRYRCERRADRCEAVGEGG